MRLRVRHAARAGYEVTRPEETTHDGPTRTTLSDSLVAVLGVEGPDAGDVTGTAAAAAKIVRSRADDLGTSRVLLVPDPAFAADDVAPELVETVATETAAALARTTPDSFEVVRAPLGTYVATDIETKAHPFADSTHTVRPDADADSGARSGDAEWLLVTPDGARRDPDEASLQPPLARLSATASAPADAPTDASADVFARLAAAGLADTPASAPGAQARWLSEGVVVRETITADIADRFADAGATPVVTPPVADPGESVVGEYAATAPRQYTASSGDERALVAPTPEVGLRAALRDALEAGSDHPVRLAETPGWSARPDGAGGTRPTMLTAAAPGDPALTSLQRDTELAVAACANLGVADGVVCRLAADAPVGVEWVATLASSLDRPVLVERSSEEQPERAVEVMVVATAGLEAPLALGRVRLDTAGGETLVDGAVDDEEYRVGTADDGHPWLVTSEPVGSVEAAAAAVLANRRNDANRLPLPVALAPTQVRLLPLEPGHGKRCVDLATTLRAAGVRADVDDRDRPVAARLDAAADVPFAAVVGDREAEGGPLKVTDAAAGSEREMTVEALRERVAAAVEGWPRPRSRLPVRLSERSWLRADEDDGDHSATAGDNSQR
jgi:threonyl-tRNA synthetase